MARDDFDYIAFKILAYYYAVAKNKIVFDEVALRETVNNDNIDETYFAKILKELVEEELLEGIVIVKVWSGTYIIASDLIDGEITMKGARYLRENSEMKKAKEIAKTAGGLIQKLLPFITA